jgi:hypothetical protein
MLTNYRSTVSVSRTALESFVLGDIEILDRSAALIFCEELNGVKGFHAGFIKR